MIFLTIGTHEPFDRLVRAVDGWCAARGRKDVFGQITDPGKTGYRPAHFEWVARMTPDAYRGAFEDAEFIIAHAGMGSIITAFDLGKPIALLPRRGHLRETRNDHQFATVQHLAGRPGLFIAEAEDDLPAVLDKVAAKAADWNADAVSPFAQDSLIAAIRDEIRGD